MTLVKEYLEYTKKYKALYGNNTLVLMQVGSFFECYAIAKPSGTYEGSNIIDFTNINDMIIAKKNTCIGEDNVVMAGFGLGQLDKYVKKMLNNGYTVVVFTQDVQAKNTTRSLACIYSPGTYFDLNDYYENANTDLASENINYNSGLSNNTICIWIHYTNANSIIKEPMLTIGLNVIDILTGKIIMYEYNHTYINSPTTYDQLEKYIAIYNPSEVIIITNKTVKNDVKNVHVDAEKDNFIDDVISYANIHAPKIHKIYMRENAKKCTTEFERFAINCEKQIYQESIIDKIYGSGSFQEKSEFHEYSIANQSLCFLLDFIEKHNPALIRNIDYPVFENHCHKLILANHSLKQLNIISDQRYNGKLSCVANFLNNCITNSGRRRFNYDLLHPICDVGELNKSYDVVANLQSNTFYKIIREYLYDVRDIEKIERKLIMKKLDPKDFAILHSNLSKISTLFQKIINDSQNSEFYKYIAGYIKHDITDLCDNINQFIEKTFNLEKASTICIDKLSNYSLDDLNFINKNYNSDLNILLKNSIDSREQLDAICHFFSQLLVDFEKPKISKSKVVKKQKEANNDLLSHEYDKSNSNNYVKIHETSKNDAMLVITKRRAMILKELLQKLISKTGANHNVAYVSKYSGKEELINLDLTAIEFKVHGNNQTNMIVCSGHINEIAHSIQNSKDILIDGISQHYQNILTEFHNDIEGNITFESKSGSEKNQKSHLSIISHFIGLIDVCHCKAYNADKYNYCKPQICEKSVSEARKSDPKSYVNFKKMRHCLIEHINNKELYVANDLSIGEENNGMLLYGTNAVGKTSFIKSIGIAIIMAQAGMYVPCSEFKYYPYQYLFTRILGNDNIFKGLSTFAVEMCELRTILKNATQNSLILGDELCSGTESTSALSIFVSSLERLHTIESTFLFATHFHEILEYEEIQALKKMRTFHMSVIFDRENGNLVYDRKLRDGPGEAMYGLEVCKSLSMPDDFIERAYAIRNKYSKTGANMLDMPKSRYNAKKLRGQCEICNLNKGTEVHHLQFQKHASPDGIIKGEFNKNKKANLINICEKCHLKIHDSDAEYRISKTTSGYELIEV